MSTTLLYSQTAVLTTKDDINKSVHNKLAHPIIPMRTTTTTATTVETNDVDGLLPIQLAIDNEDKDALDKEINALFGVPVSKKKNYLSPSSPTSHEHKEENEDDVNCNTVPPSDSSGSCPTASNGELLTITKKKRSSPTRLASFRSSLSSSFLISSRKTTSNKHRARTITRKSSYLSSRKSSTLSSLSSQHIDISDGEDNTISQIDEHTQRCAVEAAKSKKKYFRSTLPKSLLKVYDSRDCVASFQRDEAQAGKLLGQGEYSSVFEVESFNLHMNSFPRNNSFTIDANGDITLSTAVPPITGNRHNSDAEPDEFDDQRSIIKKKEKYRDTNKARYAIKHIKETYHRDNDPESYIQAAR